MMSIFYLNIGRSRQLYGMVNRFLGFMAETYLDALQTIGFKDFNPMLGNVSELPLSTKYGNLCHSEWLHGIYTSNFDKQKSKYAPHLSIAVLSLLSKACECHPRERRCLQQDCACPFVTAVRPTAPLHVTMQSQATASH